MLIFAIDGIIFAFQSSGVEIIVGHSACQNHIFELQFVGLHVTLNTMGWIWVVEYVIVYVCPFGELPR